MRDFKLKLKLIFRILSGSYTTSEKHKCWWLWDDGVRDEKVIICFGKDNFEMFNYDRINKEEENDSQ